MYMYMYIHAQLQIRAFNVHELSGNWSEAVWVEVPTVEPTETGSSPQVWIYVVAAVAVVLLASVAVVVCICIYQRYCFHRRIKLVRRHVYMYIMRLTVCNCIPVHRMYY